jgi:hypothetical protein
MSTIKKAAILFPLPPFRELPQDRVCQKKIEAHATPGIPGAGAPKHDQ